MSSLVSASAWNVKAAPDTLDWSFTWRGFKHGESNPVKVPGGVEVAAQALGVWAESGAAGALRLGKTRVFPGSADVTSLSRSCRLLQLGRSQRGATRGIRPRRTAAPKAFGTGPSLCFKVCGP